MSEATLPERAARVPVWLWPLWALTAFASTLCGIGGGLFAVPMLHFLVGLPLALAVGTSMGLVAVLAATATVAELAQPAAALEWGIVLPLVAGGFIGSRAGVGVARRISNRRLTQVFAVVLALAGLRVLVTRSMPSVSEPLEGAGDVLEALVVAAVGLGGGFVAPLLGVGGGLLVVPGLFLGVPGMTYLEARASALAMALPIAVYVTVLNARSQRLHVPSVRRYAPATLAGAVAGTFAVHLPGWAEVARVLLGLVLLATSVRFGLELARAKRAP